MPNSDISTTYSAIRANIIDWLDDNYHFGDAASLIGSDDASFTEKGILDSLGFVKLIVHLEGVFGIRIERKELSPRNFDSLEKIVTYVASHRDFKGA